MPMYIFELMNKNIQKIIWIIVYLLIILLKQHLKIAHEMPPIIS